MAVPMCAISGTAAPDWSGGLPDTLHWCNYCTILCSMVTVYRGTGWKIAIYGRDHGVPHFHIEGPGWRCSVAIETCEVIVGVVPATVLQAAKVWARKNRSTLNAIWQELNG